MNLENRIHLLLISQDIHGLNGLLALSSPRVTFWGTRVIEVQGVGSANLHSLIARSLSLLDRNQSEEGNALKRKLGDLLAQTDQQLDSANCFTKVLNVFQEFVQIICYGNIRWSRDQPYDELRQQTSYSRIFPPS
jgi:hypothetical protein